MLAELKKGTYLCCGQGRLFCVTTSELFIEANMDMADMADMAYTQHTTHNTSAAMSTCRVTSADQDYATPRPSPVCCAVASHQSGGLLLLNGL